MWCRTYALPRCFLSRSPKWYAHSRQMCLKMLLHKCRLASTHWKAQYHSAGCKLYLDHSLQQSVPPLSLSDTDCPSFLPLIRAEYHPRIQSLSPQYQYFPRFQTPRYFPPPCPTHPNYLHPVCLIRLDHLPPVHLPRPNYPPPVHPTHLNYLPPVHLTHPNYLPPVHPTRLNYLPPVHLTRPNYLPHCLPAPASFLPNSLIQILLLNLPPPAPLPLHSGSPDKYLHWHLLLIEPAALMPTTILL